MGHVDFDRGVWWFIGLFDWEIAYDALESWQHKPQSWKAECVSLFRPTSYELLPTHSSYGLRGAGNGGMRFTFPAYALRAITYTFVLRVKGEDPHFHPDGKKHREHHTYPKKGFPGNEEY